MAVQQELNPHSVSALRGGAIGAANVGIARGARDSCGAVDGAFLAPLRTLSCRQQCKQG